MTDGISTPQPHLVPLDEAAMEHMKRLRRILRFLATDERISHMEGRIKIFGSAASGKSVPGDIDAYFDFTDSRESYQHPSSIQRSQLILNVAEQFYGCFDPFMKVGKHLYVRNDNCNGWIPAKQAQAIRLAGESGRDPRDVHDEIRSRPFELGGAPRKAEPAVEPDADATSPGM